MKTALQKTMAQDFLPQLAVVSVLVPSLQLSQIDN
jgi:hypothetical protein